MTGQGAQVLIDGVVIGAVHALTVTALILVHRASGVVNLAQTAVGLAGGELALQLVLLAGVPFLVAAGAGILAAALVGAAVYVAVVRPLAQSPSVGATIGTVAVAAVLGLVGRPLVAGLPFVGSADPAPERLAALVGQRTWVPLADATLAVGGGTIDGFQVVAVILAAAVVGGVILGAGRTAWGLRLTVLAASPDEPLVVGQPRHVALTKVWLVAGALGGLGAVLSTGLAGGAVVTASVFASLLVPLAAATGARFRSLALGVSTALLLGIIGAAVADRFPERPALWPALLLVAIVAGALRRGWPAIDDQADGAWQVDEPRPVPREFAGVTVVRVVRGALVATGLLAVTLYPWIVSTRGIVLGGLIAVFAIVALSLVVVTGWSGQVSLGQFAFVAVGAMTGGYLSANVGLSFWLAAPLATALAAVVGVLLGLATARARGPLLAVATLAFGLALPALLFDDRLFGWLRPRGVDRPSLLLLDFDDERSMYYLCVAAFLLATAAVLNLRRSPTGRALLAARDHPAALVRLGGSAVRARVIAGALSGGIAGFAGVVFVHLQRGVAVESFAAGRSIDVLLLAVVGGVTSVGGVLLGSVLFNAREFLAPGNLVFAVLTPAAALVLAIVEPRGLIGLVHRARDNALRIVAQRRQLHVPALFGHDDADADDVTRYPLAPPLPGAGLAVVPAEHRFAVASRVLGTQTRATRRRAGRPARAEERRVIHAAAEAARVREAAT